MSLGQHTSSRLQKYSIYCNLQNSLTRDHTIPSQKKEEIILLNMPNPFFHRQKKLLGKSCQREPKINYHLRSI